EVLARIGQQLGGELDEARIIQTVLDGGREITGAGAARFLPGDPPLSGPCEVDRGTSGASRAQAPVVSRTGEALGLLVFERPSEGAFTPREQALAAALASQLSIAIENARLLTQLQAHRARAEEASR